MRRKVHLISKMLGVTLCMLLLASVSLTAQEKMPITTSSDEAKDLYMTGRDYFEMLQFPKAVETLKQATEIDPEFAMAYLLISSAEGRTAGFSKKYLDKAVKYSDKVSEGERHMILYAKALMDEDTKVAEQHIKTLVKLYPDDERVQMWAGYDSYNKKDYASALKHLEKAIEINKDFHPAINMLGYTHMAMGEIDEAERYFKKYIELQPEIANSHDSYAEFLKNQGRFDESTEHYKKALKYDPTFVASLKGLGDNYLFKGDFVNARNNYKTYATTTNNNSGQFSGMLLEASVDLHQNNIAEALRNINNYIELAREKNLPYYEINGIAYKGYILTETGDPAKGLEYYKNAKQLIETADLDEKTRENLRTNNLLWEFHAYTAMDDMTDAEKYQTKCRERLADIGTEYQWQMYHTLTGIMEIKNSNYDKARQHFASGIDQPISWYYTGLSYDLLGNRQKAVDWYQKVAQYYSNSLELGTFRNKAMAGLKD